MKRVSTELVFDVTVEQEWRLVSQAKRLKLSHGRTFSLDDAPKDDLRDAIHLLVERALETSTSLELSESKSEQWTKGSEKVVGKVK